MATPLKILRYVDFDSRGLERVTEKVITALAQGDFAAAQVKKLQHVSLGKLYRARLNDADRLLFSLVRHENETALLLLEVIRQHRYEQSRFLRGAQIDAEKMVSLQEALPEAEPLRYLPSTGSTIHFLDKPLSFDDSQQTFFAQTPPLILVGGAGSGKTALLLEKLKTIPGEVLYVTHSAYLAEHARELYYAHGYQREEQEAAFLSYRAYLETWQIPEGREVQWRDFANWFQHVRSGFRGLDAHQAFEEIRGVLCARPEGVLTRDAYLALGVRQSIFAGEQREVLYSLFARYQRWLTETGLYDLNLLAHQWRALVQPRYDFVVIDEVQDLTAIQLALVLRSLRKPDSFLLGGDSNQIVHPNFFSWSQIKSLFWSDPEIAARQSLGVLRHNFRNGREVTRVANRLLEIKQQRFGSIDRESNFLVEAVGNQQGAVTLVAEQAKSLADLNAQISRSTHYAVLVLRDEDKAAARKVFSTPLLFSVQEAKGLEYPHIVLYRFLSDQRAPFQALTEGVQPADLGKDTLPFRRAKDKGDKSLEIYKFYVNALYVALTRAMESVIWIESDLGHPLLSLLDLQQQNEIQVSASVATRQEWQKEARKLELQGKTEQAEAIRDTFLKTQSPPWPVFAPDFLWTLQQKVLKDLVPGAKHRQQLLEYSAFYDDIPLLKRLVLEADFAPAKDYDRQRNKIVKSRLAPYQGKNGKDVLQDCDRYGLEHRTIMNGTPLMMAARAGNVPLVEALLERGARIDSVDHFGRNACHWCLRQAIEDPQYAKGPFSALWSLLAPPSLDLNIGHRLLQLDRHLPEYLLFQSIWAVMPFWPAGKDGAIFAFSSANIADIWENLPKTVVPEFRRNRSYLSALFARNEIHRDYPYNRHLFQRLSRGWYTIQPRLSLRDPQHEGQWQSWVDAHGFPFLGLMASSEEQQAWQEINSLLRATFNVPKGKSKAIGNLSLFPEMEG